MTNFYFDKYGMTRRNCMHAIAVGLLTMVACGAQAESVWPQKPIRIVVPVTAGSATDLLARQMAPRISAILGQPVMIENKAGADMAIGISSVAKSPGDGYTWLMVSSGLTSGAVLRKASFDPVKDFAPVSVMGYAATVAVVPASSKIRSMQDLIAKAKAEPEALNYAFPAIGTLGHLHSALLENSSGVRFTGVPYKGSSPAMTDLLANRVNFMMAPPGVALPYVKAGNLVALGVGGKQRSSLYPDVPTLTEQGIKGVELESWLGVLMPAGTPSSIVERSASVIQTVLQDPEARQAAEQAAIRVEPSSSPQEFAELIRSEMQMWPKLFELAKVATER